MFVIVGGDATLAEGTCPYSTSVWVTGPEVVSVQFMAIVDGSPANQYVPVTVTWSPGCAIDLLSWIAGGMSQGT